MQGYVLAYRPATGEGSIVTGSGRTIRFAGIADDPTLHGGDWVSLFLSESDSAEQAKDGAQQERPDSSWAGFRRKSGRLDDSQVAHVPVVEPLNPLQARSRVGETLGDDPMPLHGVLHIFDLGASPLELFEFRLHGLTRCGLSRQGVFQRRDALLDLIEFLL